MVCLNRRGDQNAMETDFHPILVTLTVTIEVRALLESCFRKSHCFGYCYRIQFHGRGGLVVKPEAQKFTLRGD